MKNTLLALACCSFGFLNAAEHDPYKNLSVTPAEIMALRILGNNTVVAENGKVNLLGPDSVKGIDPELLKALRKQVTQLCGIAYAAGRRDERDQKKIALLKF